MDSQTALKGYRDAAHDALTQLHHCAKSLTTAEEWLYHYPVWADFPPPGIKNALDRLFAINATGPAEDSPEYLAMIRGARENGTAGIEVGGSQYVSAHAAVFRLVRQVVANAVNFGLSGRLRQKNGIAYCGEGPATVDLSGMDFTEVQRLVGWFQASPSNPLPDDPDDLLKLRVALDLEYAAALDALSLCNNSAIIQETEDANSANSANTSGLFPGGFLEDPDLRDLIVLLDANKSLPEKERKSMNEIAREFKGEMKGDDPKAQSLLAQIRKLKREKKINL